MDSVTDIVTHRHCDGRCHGQGQCYGLGHGNSHGQVHCHGHGQGHCYGHCNGLGHGHGHCHGHVHGHGHCRPALTVTWPNVDYIYAKASSRLYFLKQLKKCSNNIGDMLHFYTTVIRPVLEFACPSVWHTSITNEQCIRLESIQRSAIHNINGITEDYTTFCINNNLPSLYERHCELSKRFFSNNVLPSASCLHHLLPNRRDINITAELRITPVSIQFTYCTEWTF